MAQASSDGDVVAGPPVAGGAMVLGPATRTPMPIVGPIANMFGQAGILGPVGVKSAVIGPVRQIATLSVPLTVRSEVTGPRQGPRASTAEALMSTYGKVMDRGAVPIVTAVSSEEEGSEAGALTPPRLAQKRRRLPSESDLFADELADGWELGRSPPAAGASQSAWDVSPARRGGPGRKKYVTGNKAKAATIAGSGRAVKQALHDYEHDKLAASSRSSQATHVKWWKEILRGLSKDRTIKAFPLTVRKLRTAAAILKAAGYRSAMQYLWTLKKVHVKKGFPWDQTLELELKEAKHACRRGQGPAKKAGALPLERLGSLPSSWDGPRSAKGPARPRSAILVGSWWGMREIELAGLRVSSLTFSEGDGCGTCRVNLPVSKTDAEALGKFRLHGCCCEQGGCPVAAARDLRDHALQGGGGTDSFAVVSMTYRQVPKKEMQLCLQDAAKELGVVGRITAHAMRATAAQGLIRAGMELWQVQLFLRWGSKAVLGYLEEAPLKGSGRIAGSVAKQLAIGDVHRDIVTKLGGCERSDLKVVIEGVLEEKLAGLWSSFRTVDLKMDEMAASVAAQLERRPASSPVIGARFVMNSHPASRVIHLARDVNRTMCGWDYGVSPWSETISEPVSKLSCRACRNALIRSS